ncbi:hypothetical protein [Streptomyces sp. NPDC048606]|uniref:hypothetical protein n=1 Tax=Streptomyces sp. NPDC048606 TaxID=3154726 RepID=UPI0034172319
MRRTSWNPAFVLLPPLLSAAAWAAWLGWDRHRDVHPDGSQTGPYEAWQVIGLVLTLMIPVYWAASRGHVASAVLGTTAGVTAAAWYDWSDDASGLFVVGVGLVAATCLVATFVASVLITHLTRGGRGRGGTRSGRPTG